MNVNKHIIVATFGLVAVGVIKKWNQPGANFTPIFVGGFVFMLGLSVADLFGGTMSKLASGLAMVALVNGILTEIPADFIQKLANPPKVNSSTNVAPTGNTQ